MTYPSPGQLIGEGSTHQRTGHRSDAVHTADQAHVCRTLGERNGGCDDEDGSREDSCGSDTSNGASDNESCRVGSGSTDGTADLKNDQGCQVYPLDAEEGVQLSEEELECAGGQEIC